MGSSQSNGSISLQLEVQTLNIGDEIKGVIHILLETEFINAILKLRLRGKEKTHWHSRTNNRNYQHMAKYHIIDSYHKILDWPHNLLPGQYSIPFSYIIPGGIPGSFHYSAGTTTAQVIYKVQALLINSDDKIVKGKIPVYLKQNNYICTPDINLQKIAHMKTWGCRNEGICRIKVHYMQDTYKPTEVAKFYVEVDNSESKLRVNGIKSE